MDLSLLASVIWLVIIIRILVVLQITNKYLIAVLVIIALVELWECLSSHNKRGPAIKLMLLQGVVLLFGLYCHYRCNIILVLLVLSCIAFLTALVTEDYKKLLDLIPTVTILIILLILWWYNRVFCVSFPAIMFSIAFVITFVARLLLS